MVLKKTTVELGNEGLIETPIQPYVIRTVPSRGGYIFIPSLQTQTPKLSEVE